MDDAEGWRWVWLAATAVLAVAELAVPGTFFLVSFAAGALLACVLAFADVNVGVQWLAFAGGSAAALAALVPLGRRMNATPGITGVGSTRFQGLRGVVLEDIPGGPHATGLVRVEREEWRAESASGATIPTGTPISVLRVDGTRLIVAAEEEPS